MTDSPFAGKPAESSMIVNVPELVAAYYTEVFEPSMPDQWVSFGTSGHRGSSLDKAFNEWQILSICQAICLYRRLQKIDGPLFLGMDTHALSVPAFQSTLGNRSSVVDPCTGNSTSIGDLKVSAGSGWFAARLPELEMGAHS